MSSKQTVQGIIRFQVGFLNSYGTDLGQDFQSTGHQKETQAAMDWFEERAFALSWNLRGTDENVEVPKNVKQQR